MGGLVARALVILKHFKPELLNILITQATPHVAPVLPLDQYLAGKYIPKNFWIAGVLFCLPPHFCFFFFFLLLSN